MKIDIPKDQYIKSIDVNDGGLEVQFSEKKKIALFLIGVNERYWPYLKQVIEDCKTHFLPQHKVDFLVWSDMPEDQIKDAIVFPAEAVEWPAPTLMRYHLFLQQEEKLREYDYLFYLDADMRIITKISDEILGEGLTVAEHPMYSLRREYIPPYEPNKDSTAYIPRLGQIIEENGKPRFRPLYLAGGFQGGKTDLFIEAMKTMRDNIDKDFNKNYVAIWNDESHWNKYVLDNANPIEGHPTVVMSPSYVYPDSLIPEYYEPIWGKKYEPKIITLTKPFSLSKEGAENINQFLGRSTQSEPRYQCPMCHDLFETPGLRVEKVIECPGSGKPHQLDLRKI